jgi:hypothetical protein
MFLALLVSPVAVRAEIANRQTETASPPDIASLRQQYAAINQGLRRCKRIKKKLSGFSLEGVELVAYLDGTAVVKIVANHYGEGGRSVEEYYYSIGKLIFVFRRDQHYNRPLSGKVVRSEESRFYFANDRLIRWVDEKGEQVPLGTTEYQEKQNEYRETSSKFLKGVRSKGSTIEAE